MGLYTKYDYMYIYIDVYTWVVVQIMVTFSVLRVLRHLVSGDPEQDHNFDKRLYTEISMSVQEPLLYH